MECAQVYQLDGREFMGQLLDEAGRQRVPINGALELTSRCNLRCQHCYLHPGKHLNSALADEISTGAWIDIIDAVVEAGCLFLLLTGGEPLLRDDFTEIYTHAKNKGLMVTLFTNGTLITPAITELFTSLPPMHIDISLYGATAQTYEAVTGVKGSFDRVMDGLRLLRESNLCFHLKTVLMSTNYHELEAMQELNRHLTDNRFFRTDPSINAGLDRDSTPLSYRVPPEHAVATEFADPERRKQMLDYFKMDIKHTSNNTLYSCGAGRNNFYVNAQGALQPCLMVTDLSFNLMETDFTTGWNGVIPKLHDTPLRADSQCIDCSKRILCNYCPAFFLLETGSEHIPSDYLCRLGHLRHNTIKNLLAGECSYETETIK